MDQDVVRKLRDVTAAQGWVGLVLLSPENVAYATGFVVPSQPLMRWRHAAYVLPRDGDPHLVVVDMETKTVTDHLPGVPVHPYGEFTEDPMAVLAKTLGEMGLASGPIGVELGYLASDDADRLRALSKLTDATIRDAFAGIRAGMTEMDLAGRLTQGIFERGADNFKLMIVASGERSGYPNVGPTSRVLAPGDLIRAEIFGMRDGYHAGVCRTAVVGRPTPEQERVWSVIIRCRDRVLEMLRPGASAAEVYREFSRIFDAEGLPAISFVGHGIGVQLHEEPYLGKYGDARLEAGMVLGIEPLVYAPGQGMQNKDMVLITEGGSELLSDVTPAERLVEVAL